MRCIIIDDDPVSQRAILGHALHARLDVVATASSAEGARQAVRAGGVDLAFCDIELPGESGLDLAHSFAQDAEVVLVTARERYAVDAFAIGAADYLLKPVSYERFSQAVERVRLLIAGREREKTAFDGDALPDGPVFLPVGGDLVRVDLRSVTRIEAAGDYVHLCGPDLHVHSTMKAFAEQLPASFVRVHRSHIVRLDRIEAVHTGDVTVAGESVPVGRTHREDLMARLRTP